jgi:hypothetical protein
LCVLLANFPFLSFPFNTMAHSCPFLPPPLPNPCFLRREIKDSKWWAGVSVLEANPQESECWVAEHYTGYKYVLSRGETPGEYIKNTYYKNTHVEGSEYVLQSQCPFIVNYEPAAPATPAVSDRLKDPGAAREAYIALCKAELAKLSTELPK